MAVGRFCAVRPDFHGGSRLVTGWLMKRFAPDAPGSGIPQVKVAYHRRHLDFSWHLVWVKFVGGAISIGTGSSLGREGPTIHIGAALAGKIAKSLRGTSETERMLSARVPRPDWPRHLGARSPE